VFDEVTEFSRHWPLEPFDHPMADDGTFHVYVEDVAETIDGFKQKIVTADGPRLCVSIRSAERPESLAEPHACR
jgi:hypothetical protein